MASEAMIKISADDAAELFVILDEMTAGTNEKVAEIWIPKKTMEAMTEDVEGLANNLNGKNIKTGLWILYTD